MAPPQQQLTYILAPNFYMKPGTGPIALGNLIADPFRPHRALTTVDKDVLETNYPPVEKISQLNRTVDHARAKAVSATVWAQFLQTVGFNISAGSKGRSSEEYKMSALEVSYFVRDPADEEIQARIRVPRVQSVMRGGHLPGFRNPVYMVSGLMVAKDFTAMQSNGSQKGGATEVYGTGPTPLGDVGAGVSVAGTAGETAGSSWTMAVDIVFAYQLLEIKFKGLRNPTAVYDEYTGKAAFLNISNDEEDDDENDDEIDTTGGDGKAAQSEEQLEVGLVTFDSLRESNAEIRERSADGDGYRVSCLSIGEELD